MSEIEATLWGAVVGGIIGVISTYYATREARATALKTIKATEFNKAAGDFRGAFAPAIAKFSLLSDINTIDAMLKEELIPQSVAIEKFRPFVPLDKKKAYQEAWENYHLSHKREGVSSVYFLDYAMGDEKERFELFKNRINDMLKFTEKEKER